MNHTELAHWQSQFITSVFAQETQAPSSGIAIYRNNLVLTHRASMMLTFTRICTLLGDNTNIAIYEYLHAYGKSSYDWTECGEYFSQYLAQQPELVQQPYISDMAYYEWQRQQINRAPSKRFNQSSIGMLSTHDWSDLYLDLAPGWVLFSSHYDIPTIFANTSHPTTPKVQSGACQTWVCWRSDNAPQAMLIPSDMALLYAPVMSLQALSDLGTQASATQSAEKKWNF